MVQTHQLICETEKTGTTVAMLKCHSIVSVYYIRVLCVFCCDISTFTAFNMPKAIKSDARSIILKDKAFFEEEARAVAPIIPFNQVYKRISAATGVSQGLISKIVKEGYAAEEAGTKIRTPGKERKRQSGFIHVDDFDMGVIRRKVHEFNSYKNELPTVNKLLEVL
ncbi:hypothetical protein ACJJTC_009278 [Scirpophaga incertulas]